MGKVQNGSPLWVRERQFLQFFKLGKPLRFGSNWLLGESGDETSVLGFLRCSEGLHSSLVRVIRATKTELAGTIITVSP